MGSTGNIGEDTPRGEMTSTENRGRSPDNQKRPVRNYRPFFYTRLYVFPLSSDRKRVGTPAAFGQNSFFGFDI